MANEPIRSVEKTARAESTPEQSPNETARLSESRAERRASQPTEQSPEQQPTDQPEDDNTVAILDGFERDLPGKDYSHGEYVEQVLLDASGLSKDDVERYNIASKMPPLTAEGVDQYIEDNFVLLLDKTSESLEQILQDDDIQVATQSMGVSEISVTENIAKKAKNDPQFRADLCQELGIPADSPDDVFYDAVVGRVDKVHEESERVKASQERYDAASAELDERGIQSTVASGNHGAFADLLAELGVQTDEDFHNNVFDNGHSTVVGATDGNGQAAELATPNAGAEVAMDGTDIPATVEGSQPDKLNGTSFSTPQVAGLTVQLKQINPELTDEQIEEILIASSQGGDNRTGAGQVDPVQAQAMAAAA